MATVWISEYRELAKDEKGVTVPIGKEPSKPSTLPIPATTTSTGVFADYTHFIRVHVDSACHIDIGASPSATTTDMKLAADQTEYFGVTPGHKLAVITA